MSGRVITRSRKRRKVDEDVIKTERDTRRASGKEGENDFVVEEQRLVEPEGWGLTSKRDILDRKNFMRKIHSRRGKIEFPFLKLPAEIRNMIYRYLLVSRAQTPGNSRQGRSGVAAPIELSHSRAKYWYPGGIETSILSVNRQIFSEASRIFYTENKFEATINSWRPTFIDYRKDVPNTNFTRSLRSGRSVDMLKHTGFIYEHVIPRLRNLEIEVRIPSTYYRYNPYQFSEEFAFYSSLEKLKKLFIQRSEEQQGQVHDLSLHGKKWVINVESDTHVEGCGLYSFKVMIHPFMDEKFMEMLRDGQMTIKFNGRMPEGWKELMQGLLDSGAIVGKINEHKPRAQNIYSGYELLAYFRNRGTTLPLSVIETEKDRKERKKARIRRCRGCGGFHQTYSANCYGSDEDDSDALFDTDRDEEFML